MDGSRCVRLVPDIERGRYPVRGWLLCPEGTRERFEGLLGLLAVLDAARATERAGTDGKNESGGGRLRIHES